MLIVEDGSIVAGANTYVSIDVYVAYQEERGIIIDPADLKLPGQIQQSMDFIESNDYRGCRTEPETQELSFPRIGITVDGVEIDKNAIPKELTKAQCETISMIRSGFDFAPTLSGNIKREKFAVFEVEYTDSGKGEVPIPTAVTRYLSKLTSGRIGIITVKRDYED